MGKLSNVERELSQVRPVRETPEWMQTLGGIALTVAAVGGVLFAVVGTPGHTRGAPRSVQPEWERRDREIEAAAAEREEPPPAGTPQKGAD